MQGCMSKYYVQVLVIQGSCERTLTVAGGLGRGFVTCGASAGVPSVLWASLAAPAWRTDGS